MDLYMDRSPKVKMHAESEREAARKKKQYEKSGSPSPTTYKAAESYDKT